MSNGYSTKKGELVRDEGNWRASPGCANGKEPPANEQDIREAGSVPGLGRSPGGGHGNPLQYSCLENHMDK